VHPFHRRFLSTRSISDISNILDRGTSFLREHENIGLVLALISGILLTLYSFLYQRIKSDISRSSVLCLRGVVQGLGLFLLAWFQGAEFKLHKLPPNSTTKDRAGKYVTLAFVSVIGGIRLSLIFAALMLAHMTMVHTMLNGTPVIVIFLSWAILKSSDSMTKIKALASFMLIGGVILTSDLQEVFEVNAVKSSYVQRQNILCNSIFFLGSANDLGPPVCHRRNAHLRALVCPDQDHKQEFR
jgi:drug/metabolite transporter (DMT)-like permease